MYKMVISTNKISDHFEVAFCKFNELKIKL